MQKPVVGVDMGGTKIQAGLISDNQIISHHTVSTPAAEAEPVVLSHLMGAIDRVFNPGCAGIGVGVPSVVDSRHGIVYDVVAIPAWKEVHLKRILEARYQVPVFVNNDSNCFALGEKYFGQGQGYSDFVAITLGTGLGCGIIIDHKLYSGAHTGAGEVGSIPYRSGILEQYTASGFFKALQVDGAQVFEQAKAGEVQARLHLENYGLALSEALKIIMYTLDPQLIILGGSISRSYEFFIDALWRGLSDFLYPKSLLDLRVVKSELENSALLGAAALVWEGPR